MMRTVNAVPLSVEGFRGFGDVVSAGLRQGKGANQGTAVRFDGSAALDNRRPDARPNLAVFRCMPQAVPFTVKLLEKHPASTQAFLPMVCRRFLIMVAPALHNGTPDVAGLRAFVCGPGEGINYHADVWHHPIIALDAPAEFAMLAWEAGTPLDCVEHPLEEPLQVLVG